MVRLLVMPPQGILRALGSYLIRDPNRTTCIIFNGGNCFAAGTPILTPGGAKAIESFQVGDTVYSRPDEDPNGAVRIGIVDAIFERSTHIWEVHVGGKVIQTTGEHPFYIVDRGWTTANRLEAGDRLVGHNEHCEVVARVVRTTRTATVYNVRVESDHTYFVGGDDWGFSIWAHNAKYLPISPPPIRPQHGGRLHNDTIIKAARAAATRPGVTGVATNQAVRDNVRKIIAKLKPDVQYIENDLVHIIEVNVSGGAGYHKVRREQLKALLGILFGSYTPIDP